jgi:ABC-type glycerol-3-phosphate transport system substrate-binding protein
MNTKLYRILSLIVILVFLVAACTTPAPTQEPSGGQEQPPAEEPVEITFWWWAESDAPGADAWMAETVEEYKKVKPNVTVTVVPQSTDTLMGAFQSAVTAGSGPDIASQWATGPVMGFVWQDALVPFNDYVPQSEIDNWVSAWENVYDGKLWGMPLYMIGIVPMYNKDLFAKAGVTPPAEGQRWTWDELQAACEKFKAAEITCWGIGDKDGYGGAWFFSNVGSQGLNSTDELRQAVIGKASFTDEKYTGWYKMLDEMVKNGYFNEDVMSLDLSQGVRTFWEGKAAIAFGTDGMIREAQKTLGVDKVGVMLTPKWGNGTLADSFNGTQSISFLITKWSPHPQEAADFLVFLHTPERMASWYQHTGVVPADKRFDTSVVTDPVMKQLVKWVTTGKQVWLENWIPAQLDGDADLPAGQLIFSQSGTPEDAANLWQSAAETWRNQHPDELAKWENWQQEIP